MIEHTKNRIYFIDYLRGFMILLVVLDHSMHAYSQYYAQFWFFPDVERSILIDVLHLHNDAIMMPFLFFLAGIFVIPSLKRRGYISFLKERFIKLVIPFLLGIFFVSPILVFYKTRIREGFQKSFTDFWYNDYIRWQDIPFEHLNQTGYWFLYFLAVLTLALVLVYAIIPKVIDRLGICVRWCFVHPVTGFCIIGLILAIILGFSDLRWGSPWWIGFKPVFHIRGSRFIAKIFFFTLGVGLSQSGLLQDQKFLNQFADKWKTWIFVSLTILTAYISYTLLYFDTDAYSDLPHYYFGYRHTIPDYLLQPTWQKVLNVIPGILIRTTLLGFVMLSLSIAYMAVFKYFIDKPVKAWQSLAACSFGIYIFHEPIPLFLHYQMYGADIDPIIKFIITGLISVSLSWLLVAKVFLKLPGLRRIL